MCAAVAVRRRCYPFSEDHISKHQSKMIYQKYRVKDIDAHFDSIRLSCIKRLSESSSSSSRRSSGAGVKKATASFFQTLSAIFEPPHLRSNSEPFIDAKTGSYRRPSLIEIPEDSHAEQQQIVCYSLNNTPVGHLSDSE
eukprot:TRINITY_DN78270_c0_g1_i1.p1 TRINITY_DN78270_c0_g1~~TRINITY_DN78270_c0_g1_i1.p1  ORF type:complete len:139 (+),score=30.18 TRINITY_DN78270_c0_g1_i1:102-518(+)